LAVRLLRMARCRIFRHRLEMLYCPFDPYPGEEQSKHVNSG